MHFCLLYNKPDIEAFPNSVPTISYFPQDWCEPNNSLGFKN